MDEMPWTVTQTFTVDGRYDGEHPSGSIRFGSQVARFATLDEAVGFTRAREDEFARATEKAYDRIHLAPVLD